jgi:hypothetical protein
MSISGVCAAAIIVAQQPFTKLFVSTSTYNVDLLEMPDQSILSGIACGRGYTILNSAGHLLQSTCFGGDTVLNFSSLALHGPTNICFSTTYYKDPCGTVGSLVTKRRYPAIGLTDLSGSIINFRYYLIPGNCTNSTFGLEILANKSVVTWGREKSNYILAVDSTLEPLWVKHYTGNGGVQVVKELANGDLLAGMNTVEAGAVVARLDASGNTIWSKSFVRPNGMIHDILAETDDTFIITGTTDSTAATNLFEPLPASFQPKLFMMKLDGDGTVQWCKGYNSAPNYWNTPKPSRIVRTLDGNYAVLATLGYPGSIIFYRPFLMKTDQNGDTLWTRSVGRAGFDQYASDLLAVSDGGFVVSGGIWGDLPSNYSGLPLIFKTDSLGRSACWPRHQPIEVVDLFPTDSSITLTYEEGVLGLPAFINDTLLGPMTIYSGCEFSTGIQRYTSSPPRLYPNPTPGRFTVEFADPLMAESYYSLFDTMGKLLLQRPLPTGATLEEVDLSRFGAGSYVIKFTSPEGVCYERVVVE